MQIAPKTVNVLCITQKCINATYRANAQYINIMAKYLDNGWATQLGSCILLTKSDEIPRLLTELWHQYIEPVLLPEKLGVLAFIGPNPLDDKLYQFVYPLSYSRRLKDERYFVITSDISLVEELLPSQCNSLNLKCEHISIVNSSESLLIERVINNTLRELHGVNLFDSCQLESVAHTPDTAITNCIFSVSGDNCLALLPIMAAIIDKHKGTAVKKFVLSHDNHSGCMPSGPHFKNLPRQ